MWWRILIPTWRFFDSVGSHPQLLVKKDQPWSPTGGNPWHLQDGEFSPTSIWRTPRRSSSPPSFETNFGATPAFSHEHEPAAPCGGGWQDFLKQPKLHWYSLFFNPQGSFYHACNNLLDRLIEEISDGQNPKETVSYALVQDLVGGAEFKIILNGEEILRSDS
jgi:hypothetical protein